MTKLEEIRTRRGMSKYRLSQLSGLSQTYIGNVENGKTSIDNMTVKKVKALAKALNVHYTELLD